MKHLLYEHQQNILTLKVDAEEQLVQAASAASERIQHLVLDKRHLQRDYNEQASDAVLSTSTGIA